MFTSTNDGLADYDTGMAAVLCDGFGCARRAVSIEEIAAQAFACSIKTTTTAEEMGDECATDGAVEAADDHAEVEVAPASRRRESAAPASTLAAPGLVALTLDASEAAALIGIARSTFWKLHASGRTPAPLRMSGRVVRWRRAELAAWVAAGCPAREKWKFLA
jgi:predicted DNA-binding transcriptional regulator AlpA